MTDRDAVERVEKFLEQCAHVHGSSSLMPGLLIGDLRALVARTPPLGCEPSETMLKIADRLVEQHDEPWPSGSEGDRLHYWRDKAIAAADQLRALTQPKGSPNDA